VASERVRKTFERVRKRGRVLRHDTAAETVHRLRIDCKKLRYLLEFFRSLFEPERVLPFIRSLKRLQDHLGDFNDLAVQQADLRKTAAKMLEDHSVGADTLLAMGCLVGRLERRQRKLKRRLVGSVREFVNDANRARLRKLAR
jgi:CHAD domain-containing protein